MSRHALLDLLDQNSPIRRVGRVTRVMPTFIEADGPSAPIGALCALDVGEGGASAVAEVVSLERRSVVLAPLDHRPIRVGARVSALTAHDSAPVGDAFLGRAVDALGRPLDGRGPIFATRRAALAGVRTAPLDRISPDRRLETGVRVIDTLLPLAVGQRVGVFAASGVGKTSLVTQLVRQVEADACVICLVGERGREVEALWRSNLDDSARSRTCLVAATSDETAAMRARAGDYALALAETWRDQGRHVLLIMDSMTRFAMALRELGLAAGEPPTLRAYTPSVFSAIPRLVERCGAVRSGGAISAVMTVLAETDDVDDPISEMLKSLLDGHIVLSRALAERGSFPAIDPTRSLSRLSDRLVDARHRRLRRDALADLALYDASRMLIESGVYVAGAQPDLDRALARRTDLLQLLQQGVDENCDLESALSGLGRALDVRSKA